MMCKNDNPGIYKRGHGYQKLAKEIAKKTKPWGINSNKMILIMRTFVKYLQDEVRKSPIKGKLRLPNFGYISWIRYIGGGICGGHFKASKFKFVPQYDGKNVLKEPDFNEYKGNKDNKKMWFSGKKARKQMNEFLNNSNKTN